MTPLTTRDEFAERGLLPFYDALHRTNWEWQVQVDTLNSIHVRLSVTRKSSPLRVGLLLMALDDLPFCRVFLYAHDGGGLSGDATNREVIFINSAS